LLAPLLGGLFLLTASGEVQAPPSKGLTYVPLNPLRLRVGRIEIQKSYVPLKRSPYVDHLFHTPPGVMLQQWILDRFIPEGGDGSGDYALITLEEAYVIEERLPAPPDSDLGSWLTTTSGEQYRARGKIEIMDARGMGTGMFELELRHGGGWWATSPFSSVITLGFYWRKT